MDEGHTTGQTVSVSKTHQVAVAKECKFVERHRSQKGVKFMNIHSKADVKLKVNGEVGLRVSSRAKVLATAISLGFSAVMAVSLP